MLCFTTLDSLHGDLPPSAVATCVQYMLQLRTLVINNMDPIPVFQAMTHRVPPLLSVDVEWPLWVCMYSVDQDAYYVFASQTWTHSTVITVLHLYVCVCQIGHPSSFGLQSCACLCSRPPAPPRGVGTLLQYVCVFVIVFCQCTCCVRCLCLFSIGIYTPVYVCIVIVSAVSDTDGLSRRLYTMML